MPDDASFVSPRQPLVVDAGNSTTATLGGGATFTGTWRDLTLERANTISVIGSADQNAIPGVLDGRQHGRSDDPGEQRVNQ